MFWGRKSFISSGVRYPFSIPMSIRCLDLIKILYAHLFFSKCKKMPLLFTGHFFTAWLTYRLFLNIASFRLLSSSFP